jgi:hypothetical protein
MDDTTIKWIGLIISGIQLLVVLGGVVWAFIRFRNEDPLYPRIEFDIKSEFFGPQSNAYLTSFTISANNKGNVEHKFTEIRIRVRGIKKNATLTEFEKYPPMVKFPEKIMEKVNIVPPELKYFFVRPGVNQAFQYATQIPDDIHFIIVRATFKYQSTGELHTAERVFEVKCSNA